MSHTDGGQVRPFLRAALGALCAALLLGPGTAEAQWVRVRARTALWAELSGDGTRLVGWLTDDRGVRLPGLRVMVQVIPGPARWTTTEPDGAFSLPAASLAGPATLRVTFPGGPFHAPSVLERAIDPTRRSVRLTLVAPTEVSLSDEAVEVQVRAVSGEMPVAIPLTVELEGEGSPIARLTTDEAGWAHAQVGAAVLGPAGHRVLTAHFPGDETLGPSLARAEVLVVEPTTLTLAARRTRLSAGDTLALAGRLTGHEGPIAGEAITITEGASVLASARTGRDGRFSARVAARDLAADQSNEVVASYDSPVRARRSARSSPIRVRVAVPEPLSPWVLLVPASLTLASILAIFVTARGRRIRARTPPGSALFVDRPAPSGLQADRTRPRLSRFREHRDIAGVVWDPFEARPVAGARLTVSVGGRAQKIQTGPRGEFSAADLPPGLVEVMVEARGFVPERFDVPCPHDGSALHLRVHLVQVRHRALEVYRLAAMPFLPRPGLWGFWTPREVAVHAAGSRPALSDAIARLTSRFEEIYYSGTPGRVEDLDSVRALSGGIQVASTKAPPSVDG